MPPARAQGGLLKAVSRAWKKAKPSVPFGSKPPKRKNKVPPVHLVRDDPATYGRTDNPIFGAPQQYVAPQARRRPVSLMVNQAAPQVGRDLGCKLPEEMEGESLVDFTIEHQGRELRVGDPMPRGLLSANESSYYSPRPAQATVRTTSTSANGETIWREWLSDCTSASTGGTITLSNSWIVQERRTWDNWNTGWVDTTCNSSGTAAATAATITFGTEQWGAWGREGGVYSRRSQIQIVREEQTAEQRAQLERERQERAERNRRVQEEARAEKETAKTKAEILLKSCLSAAQVKTLDEHGWFLIVGETGRKYRIHKGYAGNVVVLKDDGTSDHRLCFHPAAHVPDADAMLAQKLMLESCEKEALKMANRNHLREVDRRIDQRIAA